MDNKVQNDLVEKNQTSLPRRSSFAEEDGLRSPISEGSVWVIGPIDGTIIFVTQENLPVMAISKTESVGLA